MIKYRIVEKQYLNKTEFYPECLCDNKEATNYGWNPLRNVWLGAYKADTYEEALNKINEVKQYQEEQDVKKEIIHNL